MKTVTEYRQFARACRELASKLTDPKDKHATKWMAETWEKIANEREALLLSQPPMNGTDSPEA